MTSISACFVIVAYQHHSILNQRGDIISRVFLRLKNYFLKLGYLVVAYVKWSWWFCFKMTFIKTSIFKPGYTRKKNKHNSRRPITIPSNNFDSLQIKLKKLNIHQESDAWFCWRAHTPTHPTTTATRNTENEKTTESSDAEHTEDNPGRRNIRTNTATTVRKEFETENMYLPTNSHLGLW